MSQCHEETGGTWASALSPQEALRIRSAKLICRAEVVLEKGSCKDTDLLSSASHIFTLNTGPCLSLPLQCGALHFSLSLIF